MTVPNPWEAMKAAARVVKSTVARRPLGVSQSMVDLRTKICRGCEFFDPQFGQCKACSCIIALKAQLATEKCPKGKWPFTNQS